MDGREGLPRWFMVWSNHGFVQIDIFYEFFPLYRAFFIKCIVLFFSNSKPKVRKHQLMVCFKQTFNKYQKKTKYSFLHRPCQKENIPLLLPN